MFDEENLPEGYQCECGGSITLYEDLWWCDNCDFEAPDKRKVERRKNNGTSYLRGKNECVKKKQNTYRVPMRCV